MIWLLLIGTFLITTSGIPGLLVPHKRAAERIFCVQIILGALLCGWPLIMAVARQGLSLSLVWSVPAGHFELALDALSVVFIAPLLLVVVSGAVYALGYWPGAEHPENTSKLCLFYGLISGAMILLLLARNSVLFLLTWETMALSGYFLITTEDRKEDVRRAGFIYLIATHTGTLALFGLFALLIQASGTGAFPLSGSLSGKESSLIFLLGLFGFGMKAGLMPLHIWLPGAHAAAPSHASALLSGVMIKTGIYGLIRLTSFFADIPAWWGWTILLLGTVSGILGVALALAQHDIKRLLAYHSVENIGIIAMGLGLALLGRSYAEPTLILLGLSGCLLHVINHGLFKSLLFMTAGSVIHAVGSREIDHFGGLLKRQRWTGLFFLGGAVAISGLPPFNGFVSEWLIYLGTFHSLKATASPLAFTLLVAPALALIGGLALACFVKVFGVTFLGSARSETAAQAHEAPHTMLWPMALLLLVCAWIGLLPLSLRPLLEQAVANWSEIRIPLRLGGDLAPLNMISLIGWLLLGFLGLVGWRLQRHSASASRDLTTWGCGYPYPTPRIQYTASSFGDSLVRLFNFGLWTDRHGGKVKGLFPAPETFASHTPDLVLDRGLKPIFSGLAWLFNWLRRRIQNGIAAIYLLYIFLTLITLLILVAR